MIITFDAGDGRILIYDTRKKELYEGIISQATKLSDEKTLKEIEALVENILQEKTPPATEVRPDAYDPDVQLSHLDDIVEHYYEYETLAEEFKKYAEEHYIPTVTKLYRLFDEINSRLTFKIYDPKDGETSWKLGDRVKITKTSYDGTGYVSPSFAGITPGYWETYTPDSIREYLETLASKRKKIEKIYSRLASEHPEEINMEEVRKVIKTLEIFRKLER